MFFPDKLGKIPYISDILHSAVVEVAVVFAGAAYDDVVEELHIYGSASHFHTLGELVVLWAGAIIVAWVVVRQNHAVGKVVDQFAQYHLNVAHRRRCATHAHALAANHSFGTVEHQNPYFLMLQIVELMAKILVGILAAGDLPLLKRLRLVAA